MDEEKRGSVFLSIISIIGAVLILAGVAWLIAFNWGSIPDFLKTSILVFFTLLAFASGVLSRMQEHKYVARALFALGGGLFVLSVFLISQIYSTYPSMQGVAWLLLLCFVVIVPLAYILKSPENLLEGIVLFFIWVILQYNLSLGSIFDESSLFSGIVLIFLTLGVLLYGLKLWHQTFNHPFTSIYRFWTVFYFLAIFYLLSFQFLQPILGNYSFGGEMFSIYFVFFILIAYAIFIFGILIGVSKQKISVKEVSIFVVVFLVLFGLFLMTKIPAGSMGRCYPISCYDFGKSISDCNSAPGGLNCEWNTRNNGKGYCSQVDCYSFSSEEDCATLANKGCVWELKEGKFAEGEVSPIGSCRYVSSNSDQSNYQICGEFDNQKESCLDNEICKWSPGGGFGFFSRSSVMPVGVWLLWLVINAFFIGFIVLIIWYGQQIGSRKIINLGLFAFVLEIVTRYIGFWANLSGYLMFSLLAILGGIILILGAWLIPRWRKNLLEETDVQNKPVISEDKYLQ